jgi:hypothetical protein
MLSRGTANDSVSGYEEARRRARVMGFEYFESDQLGTRRRFIVIFLIFLFDFCFREFKARTFKMSALKPADTGGTRKLED